MTKLPSLTIDDVLAELPGGIAGTEARDLVRRVYDLAEAAHQGQNRESGEPYIQHPLHVAYSLAQLHFGPAVVAAALLHDVLEDCDVTREELLRRFGREILVMVEGVTKLDAVEEHAEKDAERDRDLQELESLRKLFIAMAEDDIRVIFIKLADRLHNMRTIEGIASLKRRQRMARETLEIFAPLANRLGIWLWKADLEDLCFKTLNFSMYEHIAGLLAARREERDARVKKYRDKLARALQTEGVPATIKGRPKHIYSIYHKMRRKNVPFERIYDAEAIRVLVDTEAQCYQVLGVVHHLWAPVPGEFDDYIANPKSNGYQSLHTSVITDDGSGLEIQIRTTEMDEVAELGVAAHWSYKEQGAQVSERMRQHIAWVRQSVRELTEDSGDARAFIDTMRSDVFEERVYVFTPGGRLIDLPVGATIIDFAYHVHTDLGHHCRGARVNGSWKPLDYQLQTGDQVQVVSGRTGGPSRDWLNEELGFIKTNRAKQKIRQWFRQQDREQNIARGRAIVERELRRLGLELTLDEVAEFFYKRYRRPEDLWAAVGVGDLTTERIVDRLEDVRRRQAEEEEKDKKLEDVVVESAPERVTTADSGIAKVNIRGTGGLLTRIALCCKPLPGEEIMGYVTRGRGVTIHRQDCASLLRLIQEEPERVIELEWGAEEATFSVQIAITAYDRSGLFHDISGVVDREDLNMTAVSSGKRDRYNIIPVYITLDVPNLNKLNRVLGKIERIPNVISTRRIG